MKAKTLLAAIMSSSLLEHVFKNSDAIYEDKLMERVINVSNKWSEELLKSNGDDPDENITAALSSGQRWMR